MEGFIRVRQDEGPRTEFLIHVDAYNRNPSAYERVDAVPEREPLPVETVAAKPARKAAAKPARKE